MKTLEYRGYTIERTGLTFQDYRVNLQGRSRWGTLDECKKDIEDFINDTLPQVKRGYN